MKFPPKISLIRSWSPKRKRDAVVALLLMERRRARAASHGEEETPSVPSAPTGLGLDILPTEFFLLWTNTADNAEGFRLYRSAFGDPFEVVADIPFTSETNDYEFYDGSLEMGVTYTYYVVAYNEVGESAQSNAVMGDFTGA